MPQTGYIGFQTKGWQPEDGACLTGEKGGPGRLSLGIINSKKPGTEVFVYLRRPRLCYGAERVGEASMGNGPGLKIRSSAMVGGQGIDQEVTRS